MRGRCQSGARPVDGAGRTEGVEQVAQGDQGRETPLRRRDEPHAGVTVRVEHPGRDENVPIRLLRQRTAQTAAVAVPDVDDQFPSRERVPAVADNAELGAVRSVEYASSRTTSTSSSKPPIGTRWRVA